MYVSIRSAPPETLGVGGWNSFARESNDAWFWHTTQWLAFAAEVGAAHHLQDLSFGIVQDNAVVAICPLMLEDRDGYRRFTYLGESVPFPAFHNGVSAPARSQLSAFYVEELDRLAAEHHVAYTRIAVPALAPLRYEPVEPSINPLVRFGFFDLPWMTQVIDLALPEGRLWQGLRKGHRCDVKRAAKEVTVSFWDEATVLPTKFQQYQELHAKDAGRVTRSQRSFDMMRSWIDCGHAVLVEAALNGQPVAFALILLFREGAYYGSGCKDPDHAALPASHLIQWESLLWLKRHGYRRYDIGVQHFTAQWHYVPSEKALGIAAFKRGFGGRTVPVLTAERFYAASVFEAESLRRIRTCAASICRPIPA
jgi:hypothetical protein